MDRYRFVWFDGNENVGEGKTPEDAFIMLGFGAGDAHALDYYEEIKDGGKDDELHRGSD